MEKVEIESLDKYCLGRILVLNGMSCDDVKGKVDVSASLENVDDTEDSVVVRLSCEWRPKLKLFDEIAELYLLQYVCIAAEPSCDLYLNTDIEGKYFPTRYQLTMTTGDSFRSYREEESPESTLAGQLLSKCPSWSGADAECYYDYDNELDFEDSDLESILKIGCELFDLPQTTSFSELADVVDRETDGELKLVKYREKL